MPLFFAITPVRWVYGDHCVCTTGSEAGAADDELDAVALAGAAMSAAVANARVAVGRIVGRARINDCIALRGGSVLNRRWNLTTRCPVGYALDRWVSGDYWVCPGAVFASVWLGGRCIANRAKVGPDMQTCILEFRNLEAVIADTLSGLSSWPAG